MRFRTIFAACLFFLVIPETVALEPGTEGSAQFPAEILGVWDAYPLPCIDDGPSDSDTRIHFETDVLHGYENNDALQSIEGIAEEPMTWRVVTISDIAPIEIQGEADIYVLRRNTLTITNGERADTYIRCR
ncbi:hypothetical protein [Luteimonas terricola]|nr:hypothetical protein [Luteimonas terricola]